MPLIQRAKQIGYTPTGVPLLTPMPDMQCLPGPEFLSGRHIDYTPGGIPIEAYAWTCCDVICPDGVTDCYVQPECWPLGPGPGISRYLGVYAADVDTCWSARGKWTILIYDDVEEAWFGTIEGFRGGDLSLKFECVPEADPGDPGKFKLTWTSTCTDASGTDEGDMLQGFQCADPLVITFGNIRLTRCCTCNQDDVTRPVTDATSEIALTVVGNCRKVVQARHVGYYGDIPLVAKDRLCGFDQPDRNDYGCGHMTCPLTATILACDDGPLSGTYGLTYQSGAWENLALPAGGNMHVTCTNLPRPNKRLPQRVRLDVTIVCGVTNTGTGSVTIDGYELEDLDETLTVVMSDPSVGSCTGSCVWQWNEMAAGWQQISDTCGEGCEPCNPAPDSPPGSPSDGQSHTEPCTGDGTAIPCCIGAVTVRLTR